VLSRFDVITNFGTAEHVFNIGNAFKAAYDLLQRGGIFPNVNPAHGDIDHGFHHLHPILFHTLAKHSGFEIVDYQYIDDTAARTELLKRNPHAIFNFEALPVKLANIADATRF
jgi:hypothetical protein